MFSVSTSQRDAPHYVTTVADLQTPALVVDQAVLDANIRAMADRAKALGVSLRPHIKTHKCVEIAQRQRHHGAIGITVSTLYEAQTFADHGFEDILWAFPVIINRIRDAADLAERIRLGVVVDTMESVAALREPGFGFRVHLKVDCGYHRAGVDPRLDDGVEIARCIQSDPNLTFGGILSHSGHAYIGAGRDTVPSTDANRDAIGAVAEDERSVMSNYAVRLRRAGVDVPSVSIGSTPAMSVVRNLEGTTEARPGNYALFDYAQVALGSCTTSDCAATVVTSVVSAPAGSDHSIVDAGALALSKDAGPEPPFGPTMGRVYSDYSTGELSEDVQICGVSQEHGKLNRRLDVGTRLRVLPNHACLTVAQFDEMYVAQGNEIVGSWKVWRGR